MGYKMLKNQNKKGQNVGFVLEDAALRFIRERCEDLRYDSEKEKREKEEGCYLGTSLHKKQIPYNMQMDIDRLCLENAIKRFLKSGSKEDAFDIYFCYLEMFVGDYEKTRRMIELLSEFEVNGSSLLMKHRDHYSHSVYVFILGLAIYESNSVYRETYNTYYHLAEEHQAACHYLQYWGLASLFHDIGYPFELPFEQVASYFEVDKDNRIQCPFMAYHALDSFTKVDKAMAGKLFEVYNKRTDAIFETTDDLFAFALSEKFSEIYKFTREQMRHILEEKPTKPDKFNHYMDHAYFSATILFKKLFCEIGIDINKEYMDALTAILMHNSLYKFSIASYKNEKLNIPLKAELHPMAYMLMLCDELQCWDRTAYGRNSKKELHPAGCEFDLSNDNIQATYLYDEKEWGKIIAYEQAYYDWKEREPDKQKKEQYAYWKENKPKLKAYSGMRKEKEEDVSDFQKDIERILDFGKIKFQVEVKQNKNNYLKRRAFLSESNYINLYHFAVVLNGRWESKEWKNAKKIGREDSFLSSETNIKKLEDSFKKLSLEYKLSNINQAKAFSEYMESIGCFYTDKLVEYDIVESFSEEELIKIGILEHRRWLQEHYDMGWEHGEPQKERRDLVRQHIDMIPQYDNKQEIVTREQAEKNYKRLEKTEQDKDKDPMECMLAMLRMFDGVRIYRLK